MKKRLTVLQPTVVSIDEAGELQYSVHKISRPMIDEMRPTLPAVPLEELKNLKVIPTFQPCQCAVLEFTQEAAEEKDRLLCSFLGFAQAFVKAVEAEEHWADYCDPISGLPSVQRGAQPYSEAAGCEVFLPYDFVHVGTAAGGCKMVEHPTWGHNVYPASIFTTAPQDTIERALQEGSKATPVPLEGGEHLLKPTKVVGMQKG